MPPPQPSSWHPPDRGAVRPRKIFIKKNLQHIDPVLTTVPCGSLLQLTLLTSDQKPAGKQSSFVCSKCPIHWMVRLRTNNSSEDVQHCSRTVSSLWQSDQLHVDNAAEKVKVNDL
eukprot:350618-Chlamydomonas_euryale.AAC.9